MVSIPLADSGTLVSPIRASTRALSLGAVLSVTAPMVNETEQTHFPRYRILTNEVIVTTELNVSCPLAALVHPSHQGFFLPRLPYPSVRVMLALPVVRPIPRPASLPMPPSVPMPGDKPKA